MRKGAMRRGRLGGGKGEIGGDGKVEGGDWAKGRVRSSGNRRGNFTDGYDAMPAWK